MILAFFALLALWINNSNERHRIKYDARQSVQKNYDNETLYCKECNLAREIMTEYHDLAFERGQNAISNKEYKTVIRGIKDAYIFYGALLQLLGYNVPSLDLNQYGISVFNETTDAIDEMWPFLTSQHIVEKFLTWNQFSYKYVIQQPYYNASNIIAEDEFINIYKKAYHLCTRTLWLYGLQDTEIIDILAKKHGLPPPTLCQGLSNTCYGSGKLDRLIGVSSLANAVIRDKFGTAAYGLLYTVPIVTQDALERVNPWQARINNDTTYERLRNQYKK